MFCVNTLMAQLLWQMDVFHTRFKLPNCDKYGLVFKMISFALLLACFTHIVSRASFVNAHFLYPTECRNYHETVVTGCPRRRKMIASHVTSDKKFRQRLFRLRMLLHRSGLSPFWYFFSSWYLCVCVCARALCGQIYLESQMLPYFEFAYTTKLGAPTRNQRCKPPWFRSLLLWWRYTLTIKVKFDLKVKISLCPVSSPE